MVVEKAKLNNVIPMSLPLPKRVRSEPSKTNPKKPISFKITGPNYRGFYEASLDNKTKNKKVLRELDNWMIELKRLNNFQGPLPLEAINQPDNELVQELSDLCKIVQALQNGLKPHQELVGLVEPNNAPSTEGSSLKAVALVSSKNLEKNEALKIKYLVFNPVRNKNTKQQEIFIEARAIIELLSTKSSNLQLSSRSNNNCKGRLLIKPKDAYLTVILKELGFALQGEGESKGEMMLYDPNPSPILLKIRAYPNLNFPRVPNSRTYQVREKARSALKGPYTDAGDF